MLLAVLREEFVCWGAEGWTEADVTALPPETVCAPSASSVPASPSSSSSSSSSSSVRKKKENRSHDHDKSDAAKYFHHEQRSFTMNEADAAQGLSLFLKVDVEVIHILIAAFNFVHICYI